LSLHSNLTDSNSDADLLDDSGKSYGNASISNAIVASGQEYPKNLVEMINTTSVYMANKTAYDAYARRLSDLESTLAYYNGSSMTDSVGEAIGSFNAASASFANATRYSPQGCALSSSKVERYYSCEPPSPFEFQNITALLRNRAKNQTINVGGSVIEIRGVVR
jgi:hypothetical protein